MGGSEAVSGRRRVGPAPVLVPKSGSAHHATFLQGKTRQVSPEQGTVPLHPVAARPLLLVVGHLPHSPLNNIKRKIVIILDALSSLVSDLLAMRGVIVSGE